MSAPSPSQKLRQVCIALPGAHEEQTWGDPTYRVRGKIFAMEKRGDGRVSVWFKAASGMQSVLVDAGPDRFFVPPYVGSKGWVGLRLDHGPDWDEAAQLIRNSYALIAPKRLASKIGA